MFTKCLRARRYGVALDNIIADNYGYNMTIGMSNHGES